MAGFSKAAVRAVTPDGAALEGWRALHDRYTERYGRPEAMGERTMVRLRVRALSPERAFARTEWIFSPEGSDPPKTGVEDACLRREGQAWKIVEIHTSFLGR